MIERRREEFISNQTQGKTTLSVFSKAPPTKETKKKNCFCALSKIIVSHHRKTPNDGRRENIPWQRGQRKITAFTIRKTLVSITSHPPFVRFSRRLSGYKKFSYASHSSLAFSLIHPRKEQRKKKFGNASRKGPRDFCRRRREPPSRGRRRVTPRARNKRESSTKKRTVEAIFILLRV